MATILHITLAAAGLLALAASLRLKKKALWSAVVGTGLLAVLALADADPVLVLGGVALLAARGKCPGTANARSGRSCRMPQKPEHPINTLDD